jgi:hypothetical protein
MYQFYPKDDFLFSLPKSRLSLQSGFLHTQIKISLFANLSNLINNYYIMEVPTSSQSILEKLQLKDEKNLLVQGLPSTIEKQFVKLSFAKNVTPLLKTRKIDFALIFAINRKQLTDILKDVLPALHNNAKFWIAYPKVTSKIVSDLSRDCKWECLSDLGYEGSKTVTLDHVWTAMRFTKIGQLKKLQEAASGISAVEAV